MKKLALILFILCSSAGAMAQAIFTPLQSEVRQPPQKISQLRQMNTTALGLPFFDDFAASVNTPDPTRWEVDGGVYINNNYGLNPITLNVATLDGLNNQGLPYAQNSVAPGPSDTLTSQPINLNGLSPSDSVYLSFYWQSGGLGDVPDQTQGNTIYLQVDFKNRNGNWQTVWQQNATGTVTDFAQVFIGLKNTDFLHDSFQFRFRNTGERNGMGDVWNLDYIELDKNRRKGQNSTRDIALSQKVSPLLAHYTAMPHRQFRAAPEAALAENVTATVNNLGGLPGAISWRGYVQNAGASVADTFLRSQALIPGEARQYLIQGEPSINDTNLPQQGPFTLAHGIILNTREPNPLQRANDASVRTTEFNDYYAYDDGTAEGGFSFLGTGSTQVAQRFDLNVPDQVIAFRIYFPRVRLNLSNTNLTFRIWNDEDGEPGEVLYQQNFTITYSDELNQFYEVALTRPVPVDSIFYVGWSQAGSVFANVGFDRNSPVPDRRFLYTGSSGWLADTALVGAVMLRPVLKGETVLGIEDELDEEKPTGSVDAGPIIYPNPSTGNLYISGEYKNIRIFDMAGKEVYQQPFVPNGQQINLNHLAAGLYTIAIETQNFIITKKLILTKL